jgi:hypothetical protein
VIDKYKMAKHLHLTITDTTVTLTRNHNRITAEAALDGVWRASRFPDCGPNKVRSGKGVRN